MKSFKEHGGLLPDDKLSWRGPGMYTPVTNQDGVADKMRFAVNGDAVNISPGWFDKSKGVRNNWSIWRASYVDEPMPEVKLHVLFKTKKLGPYKLEGGGDLNSKSKLYAETVKDAFAKWKADKDTTSSSASSVEAASVVKKARDEAASSAKRSVMTQAREKGVQALKLRRLAALTTFDA